ncbi:MAG: hypothetical protein PF495_05320 [Spirochaetales bacterium]|jgi:hypothetical protein|nr:hypothetical protein [Spirochaetales bacterium]
MKKQRSSAISPFLNRLRYCYCVVLCFMVTNLGQEFAVIEKESAQDFGDGENILAVRNSVKNRFLDVVAKLDHFLVVA